jgi:hypothetical protein
MTSLLRILPWLLAALALPLHAELVRHDVSVGWISRTPKIDYVWDSKNPTVDGWPAAGSTVSWVAHVRWLGAEPITGVAYRWSIDGKVVKEGTLDLPAGSMTETSLPWTWTMERHEVFFELDPEGKIAEFEERNNSLLIHTDAMTIGFYVEKGFWEPFALRVIEAGIGGVTFEDYVQKNVRRFNDMARYAIYPDTPNGVLERWRVDAVHIVDDGALPLTPPLSEARDWGAAPKTWGTLYPNVADHSVDIQWGFPAFTKDYYPVATPWTFTIGNSLMHELAHARTMIDVYAWNLSRPDDITPMPDAPPTYYGRIYGTPIQGMMGLNWGHIDPYTAMIMNRLHHRRAVLGNYNEPWDLGFFLNDLPKQNRVRFVRRDGSAIANREIKIYRSTGEKTDIDTAAPYRQIFEATPAQILTTDSSGEVLLGQNPFSPKPITAFVDQSNGTAIVVIQDGTIERWAYLSSLDFNMEYWRGNREEGRYTAVADPDVCYDQLGPGSIFPALQSLIRSDRVTFDVHGDPQRKFDLFYSVDGGPVQTVPMTWGGGISWRWRATVEDLPDGRVVWWFAAREGSVGCPPQHSSIYSFDHVRSGRPRGVGR